MLRLVILSCILALLAACSRQAAAPLGANAGAAPASAASNVLAGTPMAAYGQALQRAKNVQDIVNRQARKQAKAIEAATGSSSG